MTLAHVRSLFVLVVFGVSLSGCSEPPSTLTFPSSAAGGTLTVTAEQLTGSWRLTSIQPAGQSEQATPAGATYSITFETGRLSTRADCNTCSGTFVLSGQTLTAGPALACTRAACPTMAFENVYTSLLSGDSTIALTGNALTLFSGRGTLRFAR
jgi:heat shock protein HslJ